MAKVQSIARAAALLEAMGDGKWKPLKALAETLGRMTEARTAQIGALLIASLKRVGEGLSDSAPSRG